jgi:hypothetical protein
VIHQCEASFGFDEEGQAGALELGEGADRVRIQGKIDRIDLIETPQGPLFRVIDYKTGHSPSAAAVREGRALQLPLYALAVQKMILKDGARPIDFGYWSLDQTGFVAVRGKKAGKGGGGEDARPLATWDRDLERLVRFVGDLLARLRQGDFPVHPRVQDCGRACDYKRVCRIAQARRAGRSWPDQPTVDLDADP